MIKILLLFKKFKRKKKYAEAMAFIKLTKKEDHNLWQLVWKFKNTENSLQTTSDKTCAEGAYFFCLEETGVWGKS